MKSRKSQQQIQKQAVLNTISEIFHKYEGRPGYRCMRIFLARKDIVLSNTTVHKYMNKELKLFSVIRRKKPGYRKGKPHTVFKNQLNQNFKASRKNQIWCTDFTYLSLTNGSKRYNCSIIDLYDRSIVASMNSKDITSRLAITTINQALAAQPRLSNKLILHSDQGSQFTSKEFVDFCSSVGILQSMSKAGCPYDNAPMERYYNTLKSELINQRYFHNDEELNSAVYDFAFIWYNHIRPHSYNGGKTPFQARY